MKYIFLVVFLLFLFPSITLAQSEVVISITEEGFNPSQVSVQKGTNIKFINNSSHDKWPASDLHPTHEIYPEFDPKKGVKPNETFQFKAEKVGEHRYHDHLNPHIRGVIRVEGEGGKENGLQSLIDSLRTRLGKFFSQINIFGSEKIKSTKRVGADQFVALDQQKQIEITRDISSTEGVEEAWKYVVESYTSKPYGASNAHDLAHLVGGLIYDNKGLEGINICSPVFGFGCYHGLTQKAFLSSIDKINEAAKSCLSVGEEGGGPFASCIHGIGHGVASYHDTKDIKGALSSCDRLSNNQPFYCYDGVFMEFTASAPKSFYTDPLYPCFDLDSKYKAACARSLPITMEKYFNLNLTQASEACIESGDADIIQHCLDSAGHFIGQRSSGKADFISAECSKITDEKYQASCVAAGAEELVFQNYSNWQQEAPKACQTLSGSYLEMCNTRVNTTIKSYRR